MNEKRPRIAGAFKNPSSEGKNTNCSKNGLNTNNNNLHFGQEYFIFQFVFSIFKPKSKTDNDRTHYTPASDWNLPMKLDILKKPWFCIISEASHWIIRISELLYFFVQKMLTYFVRGRITALWLTPCFTCWDSTNQLNLLIMLMQQICLIQYCQARD